MIALRHHDFYEEECEDVSEGGIYSNNRRLNRLFIFPAVIGLSKLCYSLIPSHGVPYEVTDSP